MRAVVLALLLITAAVAVVPSRAADRAGVLLQAGAINVDAGSDERPRCWIERVRSQDYAGNPYVKRVRVCR